MFNWEWIYKSIDIIITADLDDNKFENDFVYEPCTKKEKIEINSGRFFESNEKKQLLHMIRRKKKVKSSQVSAQKSSKPHDNYEVVKYL